MSFSNIQIPYSLELVNYHLNDGVDHDQFLELNRMVGEEFTSIQPGFLHRQIGVKEDGTWLIAVFWETEDDARNSISNIDNIPDVVQQYMSMIDRDTLVRSIYTVV